MKMIECSEIIKQFGKPPLTVLNSISFDIFKGDFIGVTGRSGSGKSTLLYVVSGLDTITSGTVLIGGENIHTMEQSRVHIFRNTRLGFIFQFHYLLPELSCFDNILMPARKFGYEKEKESYAEELLEEFNIGYCKNKFPSQISGGEQQRVAIARSLIMKPEILFADEPTGNLDSENAEKVMQIFAKINQKYQTTIMMVTHEDDFAERGNRWIHLKDGEIVSEKKTGSSNMPKGE
ncbi:MAG TPA: ATP-binding protein [Spirochaetia bacterium]|nr:MAG: ATP-binding protein [Spirochaetes bacterium GWB1_36_13]HCL56678.1 ATP-binding protein [Spirochaetia bacterium]